MDFHKALGKDSFVSLKSDIILVNKKLEELQKFLVKSPMKRRRNRFTNLSRFNYSTDINLCLSSYLELQRILNERTIELERLILTDNEDIITSEFSRYPFYFKILDYVIEKKFELKMSSGQENDNVTKNVRRAISIGLQTEKSVDKNVSVNFEEMIVKLTKENKELKERLSIVRVDGEELRNSLHQRMRDDKKQKGNYDSIRQSYEKKILNLKKKLDGSEKRLENSSKLKKENEKIREMIRQRDRSINDLQDKCSQLIEANNLYTDEMKMIREQEDGILGQATLLEGEIRRLKGIEEKYYILAEESKVRQQLAEDAISRMEKLTKYLDSARERYLKKEEEVRELHELRDKDQKLIELIRNRLGKSQDLEKNMVSERIEGLLQKEERLNSMLKDYKKKFSNLQNGILASLSSD